MFVRDKIAKYIQEFETRENDYDQKMESIFFTDNYNLPGEYYFERDGKFYMNNYERGNINETELEVEELLYNLFDSITFNDATYCELKNRKSGIDSRRTWFPIHLEYIKFFGSEFSEKLKLEQEKILKENPFNDELFK